MSTPPTTKTLIILTIDDDVGRHLVVDLRSSPPPAVVHPDGQRHDAAVGDDVATRPLAAARP